MGSRHAITGLTLVPPRGADWRCACGHSGRCPRAILAEALADHLAMPADDAAIGLLDLPLPENDAGAATVRDYLTAVLEVAWESGDALHPFGNSGWQHDLYEPMTRAGLADIRYDEDGYAIDGDRHPSYGKASALVSAAIREMGGSGG